MEETTVGSLSSKTLQSPAPYTPQHYPSPRYNSHLEHTEQLASEFDSEDEMGELSDSPSSMHTSSRPVTPADPPSATSATSATTVCIPSPSSRSRRPSPCPPHPTHPPTSTPDDIFQLADKAVQILGLTPGSLAHARACLEHARDEVRRMAAAAAAAAAHSPDPPAEVQVHAGQSHLDMGGHAGVRERMHTRARKAMSATFSASGKGGAKVGGGMGVVLGAGGREEEERREKMRRAADGVLYWQREVARLVDSEPLNGPLNVKPVKGRW